MKILKYNQIWEIWTIYQDCLRAYILKKTKDQELTNDLVHDVLLKIHKSCCSGIEVKNEKSWLFQIAYNTLMDHFNNQKKIQNSSELIPLQGQNDIYYNLSEFIEPLLNLIPPKYAIPLRLYNIEGMRQKDISDQLDLSLTATKSRIQRGRKLLKAEIQDCFHLMECKTSGLVDFTLKDNCNSLQRFVKEKKGIQ